MNKKIGWQKCDILLDCAKSHLACTALSLLCQKEENKINLQRTSDYVQFLCARNSFSDALSSLGFDSETENVHGRPYFRIKPSSNHMLLYEDIVLPAIAPFVESNSFIEFNTRGGDVIRYFFDGKGIVKETMETSYPSDPRYVVLKGVFDGYDRGPAAIVVGAYLNLKDAVRAFNTEVNNEIKVLKGRNYPADIKCFEDLESHLWVASEEKKGRHWPIVQISIQTTNGIAKTTLPSPYYKEEVASE